MTEPREDIALELARKEFEEWAKGPKLPLKRDRTLYAEYMTQIAWDAWKAALLRPHVWEWIPVKERLPETGITVLIHRLVYRRGAKQKESVVEMGMRSSALSNGELPWQDAWAVRDGMFTSNPNDVTHWAPLPSAPLSLECGDKK